jgi:crotonobetainyl-CoA:carnitine CoA-transferase CaiB-like acyl-CoA transferase
MKIVELAGIGPGPMCAMLLADLGASVIRIERKAPTELGIRRPRKFDLLLRNRPVVPLDLKRPEAVDLVLQLIEASDALIEGYRPGVMERLGLGPDVCLARNPRLAYGRITGWGNDGPLARSAGHDLNYLALTGALNALGRKGQPPTVPLTVIGDYGGGALYLALGILAAIIEARQSGRGQVVDAAMLDGAMSLFTSFFGLYAAGIWNMERGTNITDSGSHFVEVYECADGKWIAVAAVESRFYAELLERIGVDPDTIGDQMDRSAWARGKEILAAKFRTRTRDEWTSILEGTDSCFAPVLSWAEAPDHPHVKARGTLIEIDGVFQPAPAPRFSRTPSSTPKPPADATPESSEAALAAWLGPEAAAKARAVLE